MINIRLKKHNIIYSFFYIHFLLYVFTLFNLPVELRQLIRVVITFVYAFWAFIVYSYAQQKEKRMFYAAIIAAGCLLCLKLLLIGSLPLFIPYSVFMLIIFRNIVIKEEKLVLLINICFLIFFLLSFFIHFGLLPLGLVKYHEMGLREMPHRLITQINRFRSIEAMSPAGIDSLAGMVLLVNYLTFGMLNKRISLPITLLAIIVLIWTGSLTPIIALLGAFLFALFFKRGWTFIAIIVNLLPFLLLYFYRQLSMFYKIVLELATSNRIQIWDKMMTEFGKLSLLKKMLGPGENIEVFALGIYIKNPHNFAVNMLFNNGMIFYIMVISVIVFAGRKIVDQKSKAIVLFLIVASLSNNYILSIYNPLYMFVIMFYLFQRKETVFAR